MEIKASLDQISIRTTEFFNFSECFDCGQCFRWQKKNDKYFGIVGDKYISVHWDFNNNLIIGNSTVEDVKNFWCDYFDLKTSYVKIREELSKIDPILRKACDYSPGIRILRQDFWETLCSFIISQNNNIPRIKSIIANMCSFFGEKIETNIYSFPSARKIAGLSVSDLSIIKSGFRGKYIIQAASKVANGEVSFEALNSMTLYQARRALQSINGVGAKISECVLLYSLHRLNAFPLDVWMQRIMKEVYHGKDSDYFGRYAGVAQQYLFHYYRSCKHFG